MVALSQPLYASYLHGHLVFFDGQQWFYEDGEPAVKERPCPRCGCHSTTEGYDACLGHLEGYSSVCCGHGTHDPIFIKEEA